MDLTTILFVLSLPFVLLTIYFGTKNRSIFLKKKILDKLKKNKKIIGKIKIFSKYQFNHKDFNIELTDGGQFSKSITNDRTTEVVIVNSSKKELFKLFKASSDFEIVSWIVSDIKGEDVIPITVDQLNDFKISSAFPNPFNPQTQMSITLNSTSDVSVKVFNMNGQLIDVIANGQMTSGNYDFTWDGTDASSGVYFIQTEIGSKIHNQKIMLVK